jgi:hypothetical protein
MVEILLSTYNGAAFVGQQIQSILDQTETAWQLTIRDDGSADNTAEIVQHYVTLDPGRICAFDSDNENLGACLSFGRQLGHSRAQYIMLCDQDDVWLPDKIAVTVRKFREMEALHGKDTPLLVFTDATVVDAQLNVLATSLWAYQKSAPVTASHLNRVLLMNPALGCTMMVNRALLDRALPIPRDAVMHDAWLLLVAAAFGKVGHVPQSTLLYRQHGRNEAGSRAWGPAHVVEQLRGLGAAREVIARLRGQAAAFLERYGPYLDDRARGMVAAFARLDRRGFFGRRIDILSHRLFYVGFVRNVGWLLFC